MALVRIARVVNKAEEADYHGTDSLGRSPASDGRNFRGRLRDRDVPSVRRLSGPECRWRGRKLGWISGMIKAERCYYPDTYY